MISYDMFHDFTLPVVSMVSFPHGLSDQKLQPVPQSQQARFWPHQVGPGDRNRPKCWIKTIVPSQDRHLFNTHHVRIISILVLKIGFSKLCNPWSLLTVYYFQAVFRYLWATWLPLPTTQSRNCSNEYECAICRYILVSNLHVFHVSVSGSCHLSLPIQSPPSSLYVHMLLGNERQKNCLLESKFLLHIYFHEAITQPIAWPFQQHDQWSARPKHFGPLVNATMKQQRSFLPQLKVCERLQRSKCGPIPHKYS